MSLAPTPDATLSTTEAEHLADCETIIAAGLASFVEVGEALADVRDRRLYRQTHGTFEDYCSERWGLSRTRSYELISSAAVVGGLSAIADTAPANEAQARPLAPLRDDPEALASAWKSANEAAEAKGKPVTAADVTAAVKAQQDPDSTPQKQDMNTTKRKSSPEDDVLKKLSRAAVAARVEKAKEMAAQGYTSRQIATAVGVTIEGFPEFRKRHGIDVPADAVVGKTRHIDPNRVVEETVASLEGLAMGVGLIDDPRIAGLNPDLIEGWATSLRASLTVLTQFSKQLKEMTQ